MKKLSENAMIVLKKRYLLKDDNGNVIETAEEMFRRVAKCVASAESKYASSCNQNELEETFFEMLSNLDFLPNTPTLMNAGKNKGQLSACFVLPIEDDLESIFDAVKNTALIHHSGGGTGFSFSKLRHKGSIVSSTKGQTPGAIAYMKIFDVVTDVVRQGGARRGANMGVLSVHHPEILEFIDCKNNNDNLNNFNISVSATRDFMEAVKNGTNYNILNPQNNEKVDSVDARAVFEKIAHSAWKNGEPGIVFIDEINDHNPLLKLGKIEATNPCGEQPLLANESCTLGSINLSHMLKEKDNQKYEIDFDKLKKTAFLATRFLDNVIDVNVYPLKQVEIMSRNTRKIGLGVMGFSDMLFMLNVAYNSDECLSVAKSVMECISISAKSASEELAKTRGVFPAYQQSVFFEKTEVRNACLTTIAPTGTISIIADCSSGIEPLFALAFSKNILDGEKLVEVNKYLKKSLTNKNIVSTEIEKQIFEEGTLKNVKQLPKSIKEVFVTAHDIPPIWHLKVQKAFQEHTDNAISKTINLSEDATEKDVQDIFMKAFDFGLKGVTVYRNNSRESQVLKIDCKVNGSKEDSDIKNGGCLSCE